MSEMDRDWASIIKHYEDLSECWWCADMCLLAMYLDEAGFVKAGLRGTTSMYDLLLSQSSHIFDEPRLRVGPAEGYFHGPIICRISYESGPQGSLFDPWHVDVPFAEAIDRVERVLVKRLRWFKGVER